MKPLNILLLLSTFIFATGCAGNKAYRTFDTSEKCIKNSCNTTLIEKNANSYDLAFIEFTERGNLFSREHFNTVIDHVKKLKTDAGKKGIMVLVYVHGWKHNAGDTGSLPGGDVDSFRRLLKVADKKKINTKRKTIGIYIGWKGLASILEPAKTLSYWSRKNAAHQIGSGGVSEVLLRLERLVKTDNGNPLNHGNNIFSVAGHSFGAAVILSALKGTLLERLLNARSVDKAQCGHPKSYKFPCKKCYTTQGFGDGIMLLNPAIEANEIVQIKELVSNERCYSKNQSKLLNIVSYKSDWATKLPFLIGQTLGVTLRNDNEELKRKIFIGGTNDKKPTKINEIELDTETIGNYKVFRTGLSKDIKNDKGITVNTEFIPCHGNGDCVRKSDEIQESKKELEAAKNYPVSPYEPVSIDYLENDYMAGHNDIFNTPIASYLATSVILNQFRNNDKVISAQDELKKCWTQRRGYKQFNFSACQKFFMCRYAEDLTNEFNKTKTLKQQAAANRKKQSILKICRQ